jgi:hypothetical protein
MAGAWADEPRQPPWKCRAYGNHQTISTGAWKSRTDRRDSHIPTADSSSWTFEEEQIGTDEVLPMYPVYFVTDVSGSTALPLAKRRKSL